MGILQFCLSSTALMWLSILRQKQKEGLCNRESSASSWDDLLSEVGCWAKRRTTRVRFGRQGTQAVSRLLSVAEQESWKATNRWSSVTVFVLATAMAGSFIACSSQGFVALVSSSASRP